jgi:hypothetical protein
VWLAHKGDRAEGGEDDNGGGDRELQQLSSSIVALDGAATPRTRELLRGYAVKGCGASGSSGHVLNDHCSAGGHSRTVAQTTVLGDRQLHSDEGRCCEVAFAARNRAREPVNWRAAVAAPRKEPSLRGGACISSPLFGSDTAPAPGASLRPLVIRRARSGAFTVRVKCHSCALGQAATNEPAARMTALVRSRARKDRAADSPAT